MSQINDALRRASDALKGTGEYAPPLPPPPLPEPEHDSATEEPIPISSDMLVPPVIPMTAPRQRSAKTPIISALLIVFCVAGAAGFKFWKRTHRFSGPRFATDMGKKLALMDDTLAKASSNRVTISVSATNNLPAATSVATTPNTAAVAAAVAPKPTPVVQPKPVVPAAVANSTPAKFPPLRLQSIFYRPPNPSVMINGKLLCISDEIQGVLVADIQPSSVTLVLSGYTNVLTLR